MGSTMLGLCVTLSLTYSICPKATVMEYFAMVHVTIESWPS